MDFATDVHVYNDKLLMMDFQEEPTKVGESTLDKVSPRKSKMCFKLSLKNDMKGLILNLYNIYYLSNNFCNFVSIKLLN